MRNRTYVQQLNVSDPAPLARDLGRSEADTDERFRIVDSTFQPRLKPSRNVITPGTLRPTLRFGEMARVVTSTGAVTLYLPQGTGSDAGRVAAFLKQYENFHVNLQTTDGSLINGAYTRVSGLTQLGCHELLWDGSGWWFREPVARVRVHDTSFRPLGLWQFTDPNNILADTSGNGFNLTVETGTSRGTYISGDRGAFYFDGSTALWYNVAEPLLRLTGDMAFFCLWCNHTGVNNSRIVSHEGGTELEAENFLYSFGWGTYPDTTFLSEHGAGVNDQYTVTDLLTLPGQIAHVGFTRSSGVVQFWHNGRPFGAASSVLTTPTGGTTGRLRLGGTSANRVNGAVTSAMLLNYCPTSAEVRRAYNMTLGLVLGFCIEVGDS